MKQLLTRRIDPSEPMYDGQARMSAAMAVLTGTKPQGQAPTVQRARAPIAPTTASRHHRAFRRRGEPAPQVASRSLRAGGRMGGTRYYQPSSRVGDQFKASARVPQSRNLSMSSALLMAHSRRVKPPVVNRAQALDGIRARAQAQAVVNTLRHRWMLVNRPDLSDGIPHAHHLRRHARNYNRNNRPDAAAAAVLMFG